MNNALLTVDGGRLMVCFFSFPGHLYLSLSLFPLLLPTCLDWCFYFYIYFSVPEEREGGALDP